MKTIHINASREYDVVLGTGLLAQCGERMAETLPGAEKIALVTDEAVGALYAGRVRSSLEAAGFPVSEFVFPPGEASKTLETWQALLGFLAGQRLTRSDAIAALGGGVTGDLAGFAAACYQRGIRYVQLPTTLLAAADSSVGGKTAVDHPAGKNLAGAFWQPSLVLCDTDALQTLPPVEYRRGCAELIKYGVLDGEELFSALENTFPDAVGEDVLARCVEIKKSIVAADELDTGARRLLNLGHTAAHAAETLSGFTLAHGDAVAMGLVSIARACAARGLCPRADAERIEALCRQCGLPVELPYPASELCVAALADKKRRGAELPLVVIEGVGKCSVRSIPADAYAGWLSAGGAR